MNSYILGGVAAIIVLMGAVIYLGQKEIRSLNEQIGVMATSIAVSEKTLEVIRDSITRNQQLMEGYSARLQELSRQNSAFRKQLEGMKIWSLDPATSEPLVNKTFNEILSGIETSTGSGDVK